MSLASAGKGFWALGDQALHSGASFALHLALARWMDPASYGVFALAWATFLLVSILHTSFLVEPLLVFGAGRFARDLPRYVRTLLRLHWAATGAIALPAAAIWALGGVVAPGSSWPAITAISCGCFSLILMQWLLRRACYVRGTPRLAAITSAVYAGLVLIGIAALRVRGGLTPLGAFGVLAAAAGLSSVVPLVRLGLPSARSPGSRLAMVIRVRHLRFGRWAVATSGLHWIPNNLFFFVLPLLVGLEAAGALRALLNLVMPVQHAVVALSLVLLPALVRRRGRPAGARLVRRAALGFTAMSVAFGLALIVFRRPLEALLYQGTYAAEVDLLWGLSLLPVAGGLIATWRAALLAEERPDLVFRAFGAGAALTLAIGFPLVALAGLPGAVVTKVLVALLVAAMLYRLRGVRERERNRHVEAVPPRGVRPRSARAAALGVPRAGRP